VCQNGTTFEEWIMEETPEYQVGAVLEPTEQQTIMFYDKPLIVVSLPDGSPAVVFNNLCENMGLERTAQARRVRRKKALAKGFHSIRIETPGGPQVVNVLTLRVTPGWLFGIEAGSADPDKRADIDRYQDECMDVLYQWAQSRRALVALSPDTDISPSLRVLEQVRETGLAIVHLAEQQIEMEQRLTTRLDRAAHVVGDIQRRLGAVEKKLAPPAYITDEQAEHVSATVKALAELISTKDASKNHYQSIFAELYRRFGVSSYKLIRINQYELVLQFLEDWRKSLGSATT
jgi:hypothetical protein